MLIAHVTKVAVLSFAFVATSACKTVASDSSVSASRNDIGVGSGIGIANPASQECLDRGGDLLPLSNDLGKAGFCKIGSALIGDWTLFRHLNRQSGEAVSQAVAAYLVPVRPAVGGPGNPASNFCVSVGGEEVNYEDTDGNQYGMCRFADQSLIDSWTLFRGPAAEDHEALTQVLKQATAPARKTVTGADAAQISSSITAAGEWNTAEGQNHAQQTARIFCSKPVVPNAVAVCDFTRMDGTLRRLSPSTNAKLMAVLQRAGATSSGDDVFGSQWFDARNVKCLTPFGTEATTCTFD